jgi:hypothetical protein
MALLIATLAATSAAADPGAAVTLRVGVHVDAGTVYDIAADGADGQCAAGPSWLQCPATEAVRFRWGPGEASGWELSGETVLEPGETGVGWVLAREADRVEARSRMDPERTTAEDVRELFVRYGKNHPEAPSAGMLSDLLLLVEHPDNRVRRAVVEGLHPWGWRSRLGPLPPTAPVPIPEGTLLALADDPDKGVRRRVLLLVRDLRPSHLSDEGTAVLAKLTVDPVRGVRRAAFASLARAPLSEAMEAEEAWARAIRSVSQPGPPGRAAANTLAKLAQITGPTEVIDPVRGVEVTLTHHPERTWRVWTAWRREVPFHRPWVDLLLRETLGLGPALLKHWAEEEPEGLAEAIREWEPVGPHSQRFELVQRYLVDVGAAEVREALELEAR